MKWIALALLLAANDLTRPSPADSTSVIGFPWALAQRTPVAVESLGYPCNNASNCTSCRQCCLEQAGQVRTACTASGGTEEYCNDQYEDTDSACRQEDCPGC